MKKAINILAITAFLMAAPIFVAQSFAQNPPHPGMNPDGSGASTSGGPMGGGAPIDGGLSILIAMGAAYGTRKVYKARKSLFQ